MGMHIGVHMRIYPAYTECAERAYGLSRAVGAVHDSHESIPA